MDDKLRAAETLISTLCAASGSVGEDDEALLSDTISCIRHLSRDDPESRAPLAAAGAVPLLAAHLLLDVPSSSSSSSLTPSSQEHAAAALHNLSISCRDALMSPSASAPVLDALAATLRRPLSAEAAQHAAATVYSLVAASSVPAPHRAAVGARSDLVAALVAVLTASPASPARSIKDALKALFGLSLYQPNRPGIVRLGAVPALFSVVMRDGRAGIVEDATAVIAQVAGCGESVDAFRGVSGVKVLTELMDPVGAEWASARTRENAAAALLNLAEAGGERAIGDIMEDEEAAAAGIELLMRSGNPRAKAKAGALMRLLVESKERYLIEQQLRQNMLWYPAEVSRSSSGSGSGSGTYSPSSSASWSTVSYSSSSIVAGDVHTF